MLPQHNSHAIQLPVLAQSCMNDLSMICSLALHCAGSTALCTRVCDTLDGNHRKGVWDGLMGGGTGLEPQGKQSVWSHCVCVSRCLRVPVGEFSLSGTLPVDDRALALPSHPPPSQLSRGRARFHGPDDAPTANCRSVWGKRTLHPPSFRTPPFLGKSSARKEIFLDFPLIEAPLSPQGAGSPF